MEMDIVLETLREISLRRTKTICSLAEFYLIQLRKNSLKVDKTADYWYQEIICILSLINQMSDPDEEIVINFFGKILQYIKSLDQETYLAHQQMISILFSKLFESDQLLQIFLFNDNLVNTLFREFSINYLCSLVLKFICSSYVKIEAETESDRPYRHHFFSKVKNFLGYVSEQSLKATIEITKMIAQYQIITKILAKMMNCLLNKKKTLELESESFETRPE
jgi:hypothetical protein